MVLHRPVELARATGHSGGLARTMPVNRRPSRDHRLLQLRVLRLGFFQDGDVGVGIFPEREEIFVGGEGFGTIALQGVGPGEAEMRERAKRKVE